MSRDQNISVFLDTERSCSRDKVLAAAVSQSIEAEKVIREEDAIGEVNRQIYESPATITISKKRTMEAAASYTGQRTAVVLNFASATNPGGGVARGSSAQEECLCRVSTLFPCLNTPKTHKEFYLPHRQQPNPIHNDDIIYTPGVKVFKTDTNVPQLLPCDQWYDVNVITCAAPNLRENPRNQWNPDEAGSAVKISDSQLLNVHLKRLRRILDVAVAEGNDTVILGAFGCGAFRNSPEVVALAARTIVKEYLHAFEIIEFAIYCGPSNDRNYKVFDRILSSLKTK